MNCTTRRKIEMLRFWNRLVQMDNNRLTKKIFLWDKGINSKNWSSDLFKILTDIGLEEHFHLLASVDLEQCASTLFLADKEIWSQQVVKVPKLRTYIKFKNTYETEPYVFKVFDRGHRSILAQFRTGILPLAVETGRYTNIPLEYRLCTFCKDNVIEDECHFLFKCQQYNELRTTFLSEIREKDANFNQKNDCEKLQMLMSADFVKSTAKFLYNCYYNRRRVLYN